MKKRVIISVAILTATLLSSCGSQLSVTTAQSRNICPSGICKKR